MRKIFSFLPQLLIALLLVGVGLVVQSRFHLLNPDGSLFKQARSSSDPAKILSGSKISPSSVDLTQFWIVWSLLKQYYLEPEKLEVDKLVDGAIAGLTASLGDPYTIYLPPEDNQRSAEDLAGSFYGIGVELGYKDGVLAVVSPLAGSPALRAGVEAGDLILRVTDTRRNFDQETTNWTLPQAVNEIRGPKGSEVKLTLYRESAEAKPFEVTIKRDEIIVDSVELEFVEAQGRRFAHLRVNRFGERTKVEWDQAVEKITTAQPAVAGVVLDLRNNPGGFFDGAIELASEFIEAGIVVSQRGRDDNQRDFNALGGARLAKMPLVVLVNQGSASASEIVAGALRDRLQVQLVGEQTFGKGTVQDRQELSNGAGLHITVARWMLPSGAWIHDDGIKPDVEVKDDRETEADEVLERGLQLFSTSGSSH